MPATWPESLLLAISRPSYSDTTFIGRIERGFDFLGYHFGPAGLAVAQATIERFVERAARLYEQEREAPDGSSGLGRYLTRWMARVGKRRA